MLIILLLGIFGMQAKVVLLDRSFLPLQIHLPPNNTYLKTMLYLLVLIISISLSPAVSIPIVFPESVPQPWRDVANNSPDRRTDSLFDPERAKCVITAQLNGLELAHMMPSTTQAWLRANRMRRFIDEENPDTTHQALSNKIPLREDYHSLWDDNFLVLVPKPDASLQGQCRLTSHLLAMPKKHYNTNTKAHVLFHNRPCYPFPHVPIELIFARFAWALFTRNVIKLFTDNVSDELYSVLSLEVDEQGNSV
ncbi:hypothetical protein F4814DRAFT_200105 [Daldinia grandis]|nr:hypothetical protein F4814DRAFT_200105 [Daldinia grandis]